MLCKKVDDCSFLFISLFLIFVFLSPIIFIDRSIQVLIAKTNMSFQLLSIF